MSRLTLRFLAVCLSLAVAKALAQGDEAGAEKLNKTVIDESIVDLIYPVESIAGEVSSLVTQETPLEFRLMIQGDILFDFNKADLRPSAEPILRQVVEAIRHRPKLPVEIRGYTDSIGTILYNKRLSEQRAEAVKRWLLANGLAGKPIVTQGEGSMHPVAPNTNPDGSDNPEGRQKNRRVEIILRKKWTASDLRTY